MPCCGQFCTEGGGENQKYAWENTLNYEMAQKGKNCY